MSFARQSGASSSSSNGISAREVFQERSANANDAGAIGSCRYRIANKRRTNPAAPPQDIGRRRWVKTLYTAESVHANKLGTSAHDVPPCQSRENKRNDQPSRKQQTEAEKAYASHGFDRIVGASKDRNQPVRNVTGIPKD